MLKDLINNEVDNLFHSGVIVFLVKRYGNYAADDSFTIHNTAVLLMKSGAYRIETGGKIQDLEAHDLLVFPKKSECRELEAAEKLQFYLIRFSSGQRNISSIATDSFLYLTDKVTLKISLDENDYRVLSLICRLVYAEGKDTALNDFEMELGRISSNLLLFELKLIYAKYFTSEALHVSRAEKIVMKFLTVLSIHCRKHHTVQFYAGALYVTSGYLNSVVKQVTGKSAKKLITEAVLTEALKLLEDSVYTIAEIAEELEFSSASAFDIFFRKLMGCTPSEYRTQAAERFKSR